MLMSPKTLQPEIIRLRSAGQGLFAIVVVSDQPRYTRRSTISFLTSAMALAGLKPLGQALAQFMMVWQR
jgi:hypothetical protein